MSTEWACDGEEGDGDDACKEVDEPMKDKLAITTIGWACNGEDCKGDDACEDWTCDGEERQAEVPGNTASATVVSLSEDISNRIPNAEGVEIVQPAYCCVPS